MKKKFSDILAFIGDDALGAEDYVRELWISFHASEKKFGGAIVNNVLAYGPGGYGKSTITRKFLNAMGFTEGEDFIVFDANSETTVEKLYGGMRYPDYINKGETRYNVEDSWMNYRFAIFEEGLSMPIRTITALRNILQSGIFMNGTEPFQIKTEWIIMPTNRDPAIFSGNEDMEALLSRFIYQKRVDWSHLAMAAKVANYIRIIENEGFLNIDDDETRQLAQIFASNDSANPRVAKVIAGRVDITKEHFNETGIEKVCQELGWTFDGLEEMLRKEAGKKVEDIVRKQMDIFNTIEARIVASSSAERLSVLKLANVMAQNCQKAIMDACAQQRQYLSIDPQSAVDALSTLATKQNQMQAIAGQIALG